MAGSRHQARSRQGVRGDGRQGRRAGAAQRGDEGRRHRAEGPGAAAAGQAGLASAVHRPTELKKAAASATAAFCFMRIALGLEYDGSRFLGWQTQPGGGAVQDALEPALGTIAGGPVGVTCAGRTDRGVHARGQVVHFDDLASRPLSAWVRGVNALLPDGVAVLWSQQVDPSFHARYSAVSRTYRYALLNRPVRPALAASHVGWTHLPLDLEAMRAAAASTSCCGRTHSCTTWCATSSARSLMSARASIRRSG